MKVGILDKALRQQFAGISATIIGVISAILLFFDIPSNIKILTGAIYLSALLIIYLVLWYKANNEREAIIKIGLTTVEVKGGDIFEEPGLKVIAFNEFFDTLVDNKVIGEGSLNGQVIKKYLKDVSKLNNEIDNDENLQAKIIEKGVKRKAGKTTRYKLGSSILVEDEFILTAFSRFNDENKAEITIQEYVNFLLTFWNEINRLYAQRSVTVPIFGAGITRFKNGFEDIDLNELLQIMIWTFKISKIKFAYPAKLTIIIYDDLLNQVNLYNIKENE